MRALPAAHPGGSRRGDRDRRRPTPRGNVSHAGPAGGRLRRPRDRRCRGIRQHRTSSRRTLRRPRAAHGGEAGGPSGRSAHLRLRGSGNGSSRARPGSDASRRGARACITSAPAHRSAHEDARQGGRHGPPAAGRPALDDGAAPRRCLAARRGCARAGPHVHAPPRGAVRPRCSARVRSMERGPADARRCGFRPSPDEGPAGRGNARPPIVDAQQRDRRDGGADSPGRGRHSRASQGRLPGGFRADLLIGQRLVFECFGHAAHSDGAVFEEDHARLTWLRACGYSVLTFTHRQILHDWPSVLAAVRASMRRGDHLAA